MLNYLVATMDSRPLGLARIMVGAAAFLRALIAWPIMSDIAREEIVTIPYTTWSPEPTLSLVFVLVLVWAVAAGAFAIGWKVPWTGSILLAAIVATLAIDQQAYGNHLYLLAWLVLLLTIADSGAGLSISRTDRPVVRWPVLLLKAQLSVVYGFSALTKLNSEFLSGSVLGGSTGIGLVSIPDWLRVQAVMAPMAAAVVVLELFLAVFIWRPRFRPAVFVMGTAFHVAITLLMLGPEFLVIFAIEMLALYPLFLPPEKLDVVVDAACARCEALVSSLLRFDVLRRANVTYVTDAALGEAQAVGITSEDAKGGFQAVTKLMENLVPTLWIASILRIWPLSSIGARWLGKRLAISEGELVATDRTES